MRRSTFWIGLVLLGFFAFKLIRFQTLGYTFNDMYAFLQMSCSWMDGRPFMYENIWGYHHKIHNYYTVLLWGPLCRSFGAYGLFAVQTVLLLISYALVNQRLSRIGTPTWARLLLLVVVLVGPVTFWLNDHPNIGWHTELTYLPTALLFALALTGRSQIAAILAGLAVVLVKEDGAVLAALIHLAYDGSRYVREKPERSLWAWLLRRRFWFIAIGWVVVFLAGIIWLNVKNDAAEPRLQIALQLIQENVATGAFWRQIVGLIVQSLLLLLPIAGLLGLLVRQLSGWLAIQLLLLWTLGVAVLTALNFVQSSHYYGQPLFYLVSLTWPPRFVLPWAFSVAFLTLLLTLLADEFRPVQASAAWLVGAVLFIAQVPILYLTRPDFPPVSEWVSTLRGQYAKDKNPAYLQPADLTVAWCLADQLPPRSNVFAFDYLVPFFHKHYGIWPTGKQYRPADVALLPTNDPQHLQQRLPMRRPYRVIRLKAYDLYVSAAYEPIVRRCLE